MRAGLPLGPLPRVVHHSSGGPGVIPARAPPLERPASRPTRCLHVFQQVIPSSIVVRAPAQADYSGWRPLWDGYNEFYGRHGATALPEHITAMTWRRFFDPAEPVFALIAEDRGQIVGLAHYLFHRSMTRIEQVCYLSDLYTQPSLRGKGIGRALIEAVCAQAKAAGASRVYWQTHESNAAGRQLYDKVAGHFGFIVYSRDA